ncbi:MAG: SEC-C domain-containing protein [Rhodospirillales bacterium]|nr:SEC-C domain-containing protein [Rhodospirillales bacterium]
MTNCPCGSGRTLNECCQPFLSGLPAPTAEAQMRARFTAYTQGNVEYLGKTLDAAGRAEYDAEETARDAAAADWQRLEIRATDGGGEGDETGTVEFVAHFRLEGTPRIHHERAMFVREDGQWKCADGQVDPKEPPRTAVKVGRNEPCPCGSGKKFKKCCGAA